MTCVYCLHREAVVSRRCWPCQDYLDQLHSSDDPRDRLYGALLVLRAAVCYQNRLRGGDREAA